MKIRIENLKPRIIITFAAVTIGLSIIISRTGYYFTKELYLKQLEEQVRVVSSMLAKQIDPGYLDLLDIGEPTGNTKIYFDELFRRNINPRLHAEMFIFSEDFKLAAHSNPDFFYGEMEQRLLINSKDILGLKINESTSSLPFKGDDNKWYLWGFYRLNKNYWAAVRESAARFSDVDKLSEMFWYIGFGGVLISVLAAWFTGNAITRPLKKLIGFSSEIGKGDFTAAPPGKLKGEIKLLADAMDRMKLNLSGHQKEKEKILAQIAHEIRNPLGGILLLVNLIKENQEDHNKNREYLDRILKEINGLKQLITSYLDYSRPIPVSPGWIDVNKTVSEIENIFSLNFKGRNIIFNKDIGLNKIYFDESHFRQILMNLVANSLESVNENGTITVETHNGKNWEILVKDNGPGIPGENINRIFDPFFTTKKNGTGLGLAISRKLCTENNATLSARVQDGGALFVLEKEPVA
jgi:signal transduction histidine kinase